MGNLNVSSHAEPKAGFGFTGVITEVHTEVAPYGNTGNKATQLVVTIHNEDDPAKERKYPEKWSIGRPVAVLPSNDGITPVGEGETGTSVCDPRDGSRDPVISNKSVFSQIAHLMVQAGAPESELPSETRTTDPTKDFRALIGLRFTWGLGETKTMDGTAKRLIPVEYIGRAKAGAAAASAPAAAIDVKAVVAGLILEAVTATNPLPAAKLTLAIVPKLTGEYAGIKADAVKLLVQEGFKKELASLVGVQYDGKSFSV